MVVTRLVLAAGRSLSRSPSAPQRAVPDRGVLQPTERKRELITYWLYRAAERVINAVPRGLVMPAAAAVGNLAYDLAGSKQRLIHQNLAHPMGLDADDRRVKAAARRAFRNYAKYLVDMMRIGELTEAQGAELVGLDNVELLKQARAEGKGVLLCTVHVGGMDLIGPAMRVHGEALHVVADDTTYGRLYDHMAAARARQGIFLIGWRNLRGLFRALREEANMVLFCDGGYRAGDVPVEFCGEATTFPLGPATLAAKTGAPMMPVACRRVVGDRFVARGLPLVHCASTEPAEIQRATQAVAHSLAGVIAEDPGQWYMFRPVWPQTDADRAQARAALAAARRGDDWTKITA
ncbi:MAG: lysophospholipid acyltransferase family protein [Chloroflexi bacterium]|nr:lysophospholipid acyltransferase family protein [Chloroflexota bacterium]MBA3740805.1 lysophospholipid acyltransferase family protein [Chloroflexota bacterium]